MILLIFFLYIHICVYLYKLSQLKFQSNSIKLLKVPQLNDVVKGDQTWQCSLSSREVSYRLSSWAKWLRNPHVLQGFKHIWWISEPSPVLVILPSSSPLMSPVWTPNLSFNKSQLSNDQTDFLGGKCSENKAPQAPSKIPTSYPAYPSWLCHARKSSIFATFMDRSCAVVHATNIILSILSLKFPPSILENSLPGGYWAACISEIMLSLSNVISEDSAC